MPKSLGGNSSILKVRVMLVGIGLASFITFLYTLIVYTEVTQEGWGLFSFHEGPPYFSIIGGSIYKNIMVAILRFILYNFGACIKGHRRL